MSWHQHISRKLGQGHVYHCVPSPLLFITVCKRLGTEETSCSSLGIGMLSHSCLIQASSCSTVLGLLCRIFLFMTRQMFSRWKIWTAGWPFQYPDPSTQPWCCNWCSMWSGIVMLENARSSLKETTSGWEHMFSRTWIYLSALMVPFQMCKLPMPHALMQPHTIRDAGFWTERW